MRMKVTQTRVALIGIVVTALNVVITLISPVFVPYLIPRYPMLSFAFQIRNNTIIVPAMGTCSIVTKPPLGFSKTQIEPNLWGANITGSRPYFLQTYIQYVVTVTAYGTQGTTQSQVLGYDQFSNFTQVFDGNYELRVVMSILPETVGRARASLSLYSLYPATHFVDNKQFYANC